MEFKNKWKKIIEFINIRSIKNRIFLYNVSIIIVLLTIFAFLSNKVSNEAIISKAVKNSNRELYLVEKNLDTMFNAIEGYSRIMAINERLQKVMEYKLKTITDSYLEEEKRN